MILLPPGALIVVTVVSLIYWKRHPILRWFRRDSTPAERQSLSSDSDFGESSAMLAGTIRGLETAPTDLIDAVRICAIPAWFDAPLFACLTSQDEQEATVLLEKIANFSFVLPYQEGSYVYHEEARACLLAWWREPGQQERLAILNDRLAQYVLALVLEQRPRLSGPNSLDALTLLDAAYPNIRAAWEGIVEAEQWEQMRDFVHALYDYFQRREWRAEWIDWAQTTLEICERAAASRAGLQNNLGNAYAQLPTGERTENLERAIACYREALHFWTPQAMPLNYAMTQNNLGVAYADLPTGERTENLERAIACYREALRFWTPQVTPFDYAMTQNNLGVAYADFPLPNRTENLERAIVCYREALRFRTPEATPLDYAATQNNLGVAYADLPTPGERASNLKRAIACYREALAIPHLPSGSRTRYVLNLGEAHRQQQDHPAAINAYRQAIALHPDDPWLFNALGSTYVSQRIYEQAVDAYTAALALATAERI